MQNIILCNNNGRRPVFRGLFNLQSRNDNISLAYYRVCTFTNIQSGLYARVGTSLNAFQVPVQIKYRIRLN